MTKRHRKSWATRELPPVTLAEIDTHLDHLARWMRDFPDIAELLVPIWRRFERERDARQGVEAIIAAAQARARQLPDRTAGRSSEARPAAR